MKLYLVDPADNSNAKLNILNLLLPQKIQVIKCDRKTSFQKDLLRVHPLATFPTLQTEQGIISGIVPISIYLCQIFNCLLGQSTYQKSKTLQFVWWIQQQLSFNLRKIVLDYLNIKVLQPQIKGSTLKQINSALKKIENQLKFNTFLMGDSMTICDISLISQGHIPFIQLGLCKQLPNATRWLNLMISINEVNQIIRK